MGEGENQNTVIELWFSTCELRFDPLGVKWPFHRGHISDILHVIYALWFITVARLQLWSSKEIISWLGVTTWGTALKWHSIWKVENHCPREKVAACDRGFRTQGKGIRQYRAKFHSNPVDSSWPLTTFHRLSISLNSYAISTAYLIRKQAISDNMPSFIICPWNSVGTFSQTFHNIALNTPYVQKLLIDWWKAYITGISLQCLPVMEEGDYLSIFIASLKQYRRHQSSLR